MNFIDEHNHDLFIRDKMENGRRTEDSFEERKVVFLLALFLGMRLDSP